MIKKKENGKELIGGETHRLGNPDREDVRSIGWARR